MHVKPMREADGTLCRKRAEDRYCRYCKTVTVHVAQDWESHDGAYEDTKYICTGCQAVHWTEGPDA